ncbi:MAG: hypothetical protein WC054_06685, partial [Candidatus Nanopelagicales bacterium]
MSPISLLAADAEGIPRLLVEFGALLVGLGILARISARFGLSPVPLFLIAGLAFGEGGAIPLGVDEEFVEVAAQ